MKLIIPMAGQGTRLRPHTHVTPKPLMPVAGASMVERIVDTFSRVLPRKLEEAVFILGDFPPEVRTQLTRICERHEVKAHFGYQEKALGTAHAVYCAGDHLEGELITVFADTLFFMEPGVKLDTDGVVWVKYVEDPSRFGIVVKEGDKITDFIEKPATPISRDAIIGIYYVRDGSALKKEIQYLIDNDVTGHGNEYQLTDAFDRMLKAGAVFKTASVTDWLDCGTIEALMDTTKVILEKERDESPQGEIVESVIVDPVYIGPGARIEHSVIGPNVAVEKGAHIKGSAVKETIVFEHARITDSVLVDSLVGRHAEVHGASGIINVGDHSVLGPRASD